MATKATGNRSERASASTSESADAHRARIGAYIPERCEELELTQQDVAERAGTSRAFIREVEGGDYVPTIPVLRRILAVWDDGFGFSVSRSASEALV